MLRYDDQLTLEQTLALDQHFEETLDKIEPYLLSLTGSSESKLCRLWLERLDSANNQRNLRNQYLLEFYKQLKNGYLKEPFNLLPRSDRLMPLSKLNKLVASSSCNNLTETTLSPTPQYSINNKRSILKPRSKSLHRSESHRLKSKPNPKLNVSLSSPNRSSRLADNDETPQLSPSLRYHESTRTDKNLLKTYKERVETLSTIIEELENQNDQLRQKLTYYYDNVETSEEVPRLQARIDQLLGEVKNLKRKLKDVQEIKSILEKNHKEIIEEFKIKMKKQFNLMKSELTKARGKNQSLNIEVQMLEKRFQSLSQEKDESVKLDDYWLQEIEAIKQNYNKILQGKEAELKKKDDEIMQKDLELAQKFKEIESMSETISELHQIVDTKAHNNDYIESKIFDQYNTLKDEVSQMCSSIDQALKKHVESHQVEIVSLKRNVQKLKNLTQKLQEYEKKILNLVKKKDREIRQIQLLLKQLNASKYFKRIGDNYDDAYFCRRYSEFLHAVESKADLYRHKYIDMLHFLRNQWERLQCNVDF